MKFYAIWACLFFLSSVAYAEPTAGPCDNQRIPQLVTPELVSTPSVRAALTTNSDRYKTSEPVHLIFTLTNHSKKAVEYQFSSSKLYDVQVSDSTGVVVWKWSQNKIFDSLIAHKTLDPGKSLVITVLWNRRNENGHPVRSGKYSATALLLPMQRQEITGNLLENPNNDPANRGMPTEECVETGVVNI